MARPFNDRDEYRAGSKSPKAIGSIRMAQLTFHIDMTDEEIHAVADEAISIKKEFLAWDTFFEELELRKKRNLGFKAAILALDLEKAAAEMGTTPEKVRNVMEAAAATEAARITELQKLWDAGILPDRDVLTDPSKEILRAGLTDEDSS